MKSTRRDFLLNATAIATGVAPFAVSGAGLKLAQDAEAKAAENSTPAPEGTIDYAVFEQTSGKVDKPQKPNGADSSAYIIPSTVGAAAAGALGALLVKDRVSPKRFVDSIRGKDLEEPELER